MILLDHLLVVENYFAIGVRMQPVKSMDIFKIAAIGLALCFISNALPISKSKSNSSEYLVEDEWRTLQPDDKRSEYNMREHLLHRDATMQIIQRLNAPSSSGHLDGTDIIWFVQENVRTGELRYPHGKPGGGRHRRDAVSDTSRLWPNGIVYYSINANLQSQSEL